MHLQTQLVSDSQLATSLCLKSVPAYVHGHCQENPGWIESLVTSDIHVPLVVPSHAHCRGGAERFIADGLQLTRDITIIRFAVPLNQPVGVCSVRNFLVPPRSQRVNQHEVIF